MKLKPSKIENGDLVSKKANLQSEEYGIVVQTFPSNTYPSKHIENIFNSWPHHHYVLFNNRVEGPFLSTDLKKVN